MQEGGDQLVLKKIHYGNEKRRKAGDHDEVEANGMLRIFIVVVADVLSSKNVGTGYTAVDAHSEQIDELVDDSHTRHLLRSQASDHHVVQEIDKAGNRVLQNQRNSKSQRCFVKRLCANNFFQPTC